MGLLVLDQRIPDLILVSFQAPRYIVSFHVLIHLFVIVAFGHESSPWQGIKVQRCQYIIEV